MQYYKVHNSGITFKVRVQPRSGKNMAVGLYGDALKLKLTAPPVGGAANAACLKLLSKLLKVPKSALQIIAGETSRNKIIHCGFSGRTDKTAVINRLESLIESDVGKKLDSLR